MPPTAISAAIFLQALTLRRITAGHKAISSKPAQESLIVTLKTHKSESKERNYKSGMLGLKGFFIKGENKKNKSRVNTQQTVFMPLKQHLEKCSSFFP